MFIPIQLGLLVAGIVLLCTGFTTVGLILAIVGGVGVVFSLLVLALATVALGRANRLLDRLEGRQ